MALKKTNLPVQCFQKRPNLSKPEVTSKPNVTPNKYKENNKNIKEGPNVKTETPNKGTAKIAAGIRPINVLNSAVKVKEIIISLILIES